MPNQRDFKADSYQVGNLVRALIESADGDLVFRDEYYPGGVRLRDFLTAQGVDASINSIVAPISAYLQGQIDLNDIDIADLYTITNSLSAVVSALDGGYATDAELQAVSGGLQGQITSNDVDISNLYSLVDGISAGEGSSLSLILQVSAAHEADTLLLQNQITSNDLDISNLQTNTNGITGGLTQLDDLYLNVGEGGFITTSEVQGISSNLQSQINSNDAQLTGLVSISANHESRIETLENYANLYDDWSIVDLATPISGNPPGNVRDWIDVAYGNDVFVACSWWGDAQTIMTSVDGDNWIQRSLDGAPSGFFESITFGGGLFVATEWASSDVYTSPDGVKWTKRTIGGTNQLTGATYGNGMFVLVGANNGTNQIITSPNGKDWTIRTAPTNSDLWDVCYGNGRFIAVGDGTGSGPSIIYSDDGITWVAPDLTIDSANGQPLGTNDYLRGVIYGNGLYVAVGSSFGGGDDYVATSRDGVNWTKRTSPTPSSFWNDVAYGNGYFVAIGEDMSNNIMKSKDGITWELIDFSGNDDHWYSVTYGNGRFVAVAYDDTSGQFVAHTGDMLTISDDAYNSVEQINRDLLVNGVVTSETLQTSDVTIITLSGSQEEALKVDVSGNVQKTGYAPIIGGQIPLNIVDSVYSITDSNISLNSNPVCSIVPPLSGSTIYAHGVYGVSNGSFNVELSEAPAISGYYLNWMSLQYI